MDWHVSTARIHQSLQVLSQSTSGTPREDLGIGEVFSEVSELSGQLVHNLLEDHGVHVLSEHVEEEPVSDVGLLDDGVDDLPADEPEADVEEVGAHLRTEGTRQLNKNHV